MNTAKRWIYKYRIEIVGISLIALVGAFGIWAGSKTAQCSWCPSYTCYSSCPGDCVCVTPPGQVGGKCFGINKGENHGQGKVETDRGRTGI